MAIVQAPLAPVDPHRVLHRRARALWVPGGRVALGEAWSGAHVWPGALLRAGAAFVPDAASALLGLAGLCWVAVVWTAVLAHRPGAVARAAVWVVGGARGRR